MTEQKSNRKQEILQTLAQILETDLSGRITTARLAADVGVSEAALYRHFPSKARMYEAILDFCEETLFSRINQIASSEQDALEKCYLVAALVLNFSQKNAGISRLLTGEVLLGENHRLKQRVSQIFDKLELQLKLILRNQAIEEKSSSVNAAAEAKFLTCLIEGRLQQFVRSNFKLLPTENFDLQWRLTCQGLTANR